MSTFINQTVRQMTHCTAFVDRHVYRSVNVNPVLCADIQAWSKFMLGYTCFDVNPALVTNLQVTVIDAQTRLVSFVWGGHHRGPVVFIVYFDKPCLGEVT